ncbi:MAG TPA: hypothetical protein PLU72_01790 [Candidatus Ozemobacteraceae bacterium]|nr:hypothetical protein [Candidatus Ozemobacteraceae bacterium]
MVFRNARPLRLALVLACSIFVSQAVFAASASVFEFPEGAGEGEFGVSARLASEGPVVGPVSLQPIPDGIAVLDGINSRIVKLDAAGKPVGSVILPKGSYTDLAATSDGKLWTIETDARAVCCALGDTAEVQFRLPSEDGFPKQIDGLVALPEALVVADYATAKLYWFGFDGTPIKTVPWPTALGIAAGPDASLCFLALGDDDLYDRFVRIDGTGASSETVIRGTALDGARLLGFLPDGRAAACGYVSREPLARQVFAIEADGNTTPLETIPTPGGLLFSNRIGIVSNGAVWLNLSPLAAPKVVFSRYDLIP